MILLCYHPSGVGSTYTNNHDYGPSGAGQTRQPTTTTNHDKHKRVSHIPPRPGGEGGQGGRGPPSKKPPNDDALLLPRPTPYLT